MRRLLTVTLCVHSLSLSLSLSLGTGRRSRDPCKKVNKKILPRTGHEGPEEQCRYSSTLSLASPLDGVGD